MNFLDDTACKFGSWALPLVVRGEALLQVISEIPSADDKSKAALSGWIKDLRENHSQIATQINTGYGLPELEMLRIETCFCIMQGHWQAAICLTNILLEAFLKLSLVYSNTEKPEGQAPPLSQLMKSLFAPTAKYMRMTLNSTIISARTQGLFDEEVEKSLHEFRERFRNAFFHADMQKMFGNQTTPMTGIDFDNESIEGPSEIPIHEMPMLIGEAMWQNARANALSYFKTVDALIRSTLPKVFPQMPDTSISRIETGHAQAPIGQRGLPRGLMRLFFQALAILNAFLRNVKNRFRNRF